MRIRESARVVLLNDHDEVFMFRHTGKLRTYWVLPGGGVEPGESRADAALREMWEETGISGIPLGPLLWTRRARDRHDGEDVIQDAHYFLVRCGMPAISTTNQLEYERQAYSHSRWWGLNAIRASLDTFYPDDLADLLIPIIDGQMGSFPVLLPD